MKIAIGSDHAGYALKDTFTQHLRNMAMQVDDLGGHAPEPCDYPVAAEAVANAVAAGEYDFGVVICGTGAGISIAANKVPGIRCVACSEPYTARLARRHNNANMLAVGARVVGSELALMILEEFLSAEFEGGRHARRVDLIGEIEQRHLK